MPKSMMGIIGNVFFNLQTPIEQQGELVNSVGILWDADDKYHFLFNGRLNANDSFTVHKQFIADWQQHIIGIYGFAGLRDSFEISIRVYGEHLDRTFTCKNYVEDKAKRIIEGKVCLYSPDYSNDGDNPKLVPIAGSNGGIGQIYNIVWKFTNTGRKWLRGGGRGLFGLTIDTHHNMICPCRWPINVYGNSAGYNPRIEWSDC